MKTCSMCKNEKELSDFNKDCSTKDGYHGACRICQNQKTKRYRNENLEFCKELTRQNTKRVLEENKSYLNELKNHPCELCGQKYPPECMDFDHIDPATKTFEIGHCFWKSMKREKVDAELIKCRLLCCYCHADITHNQRLEKRLRPINKTSAYSRKSVDKKKEKINSIKQTNPCNICGLFFDHWKMQFDHLDPNTKIDAISNLVKNASMDKILDEIKKCQLLCIGCHRIITKERQVQNILNCK